MDEAKPVEEGTGNLTVATIALVAALIGGAGGYIAKPDGTIKPTVETTLTAKDVPAHDEIIPAKRDTSGKVVEAEKVVPVPRKVEWPMITVPQKGWIVFDADAYLPATLVITQGNVIIKKVIDPGIELVREAGGAAMNIGINTIPLNGTKTRGVDSLKNEEL